MAVAVWNYIYVVSFLSLIKKFRYWQTDKTTIREFLKTVNIDLLQGPVIILLAIYTKGFTFCYRHLCSFKWLYSQWAENENSLRSIAWWVHNEILIHLHNGIRLSSYKKMKFESKWKEMETITLSETSQRAEEKWYQHSRFWFASFEAPYMPVHLGHPEESGNYSGTLEVSSRKIKHKGID